MGSDKFGFDGFLESAQYIKSDFSISLVVRDNFFPRWPGKFHHFSANSMISDSKLQASCLVVNFMYPEGYPMNVESVFKAKCYGSPEISKLKKCVGAARRVGL